MKIETYVGTRLSARSLADGIIRQMVKSDEKVEEIALYARGKAISIAIDVLEILKREIKCKSLIETSSIDTENKYGNKVKTSVISIKIPFNDDT